MIVRARHKPLTAKRASEEQNTGKRRQSNHQPTFTYLQSNEPCGGHIPCECACPRRPPIGAKPTTICIAGLHFITFLLDRAHSTANEPDRQTRVPQSGVRSRVGRFLSEKSDREERSSYPQFVSLFLLDKINPVIVRFPESRAEIAIQVQCSAKFPGVVKEAHRDPCVLVATPAYRSASRRSTRNIAWPTTKRNNNNRTIIVFCGR